MYVSIMGDSISTYEGIIPEGYAVFYDEPTRKKNGLDSVRDTWWMQVLQTLEADLLMNNSYSGSQVTGEDFPCASGLERTNALAGSISDAGTSRFGNAATAPAAFGNQGTKADSSAESTSGAAEAHRLIAPDLVLIYIGVNDFGFAVPCDRKYAESPDEPTFRDAYLTMVKRIQNNYPEARIVCATILTPRMVQDSSWSFDEKWSDHTPLSEFNARIRSAAAETNVFLADLANRAGDMRYDTLDGLHPNKEGHRQIASLWESELRRLGIARKPGI